MTEPNRIPTEQEIYERICAKYRPQKVTLSPKPAPKPAAKQAEERFAEDRQPTEAIVARYVDAAKPLVRRIVDKVAIAQSQLDAAMEAHRSVQRAFKQYATYRTGHVGPYDPDFGLHQSGT